MKLLHSGHRKASGGSRTNKLIGFNAAIKVSHYEYDQFIRFAQVRAMKNRCRANIGGTAIIAHAGHT